MSLKDKLVAQAQKKLPTSHKTTSLSKNISEIDKITQLIQSDLMEMKEIQEFVFQKRLRYGELRENIVKNLIYVRDNKKTLLNTTFENYLENSIGITKGYFYEQVQAYELCKEYNKPELFQEVDYKILVLIARVKDKEKQKKLIIDVKNLKREDFKRVSRADKSKPFTIEYTSKREISIKFERELTKEEQDKWNALIIEQGQRIFSN